ncbi:MAG: DegT/DnrJ/EryC1/StrS family aminotransferase [Deltaproteobacteria bacterium]|nr:DegT/DnrJ/EryC1/StrS family aminotransferase [Deltaproteobacteria bacterium]
MARIPLARPSLGSEEVEAVSAVLDSGRLVSGPRVEAFEKAVREKVGAPHAVAFHSGTAALWATLRCLDVGPGDEVIVPALTFPATAEAVIFNGAVPVPADVDPDSFNLDHRDVALRMTGRTKAVIAVDQFGVPADYPSIESVLERHPDVTLVEDGACSLGSSLDSRPCGTFGEAAILSFHPRKIVTTGEGGMVLTDHDGLAGSLRSLRSHGQDASGAFSLPGLNLRMGEMEGALGQVQMGRLDDLIGRRRALAEVYERHLPGGVTLQKIAPTADVNWQTLAALLPAGTGVRARDAFLEAMRSRSIEVGIASFALPALPAYRDFSRDPAEYPGAMRVHESGIALPLFPDMRVEDVEEVAAAVREVLENGGDGS